MNTQIHLKINDKDDFVGFEYFNETITIYYPQTFDIFGTEKDHLLNYKEDKEAIRLLSVFVRSFHLADYKDRVEDKSPNENDKEKVTDYPIEAYAFIIDDYQRNGRYIEFETSFIRNGNGKIDWKKTLQQMPLIIENEPYYSNVITKQRKIVSGIMDDIYLFCAYESVLKFGSWFYGMNCNSIPTKIRQLKPDLKQLYAYTLEMKLAETFNDDTANRLKNMLMIVNGAKESYGVQRMGLKSYHSVFEKLIKWGLDNVGNLSRYNPRAVWNSEEAEDDELSPLRIDALRIENECAFILDAKFYQTTKPGAADINKQITYGENLYTNHEIIVKNGQSYEHNKIYNFFLVPCSSLEMKENIITNSGFIGKGYWRLNNHSYENVYLLNVNLIELLEKWNKNKPDSLLKEFKNIFSSIIY